MISTKTKNRWDYYNVIDGAKIQGQEIGEALGRAEGRIKGRAEGAHENAIKVAANLKAMGLSAEDIEKATGLTVEEIKELSPGTLS